MSVEKSDVLFLLVGTNPLPNLLSALSRSRENGLIYLIYTKGNYPLGTADIYEQLKIVIKEKYENRIQLEGIAVEKNEERDIKDKIANKLEQAAPGNQIIELNFTGGTKIMSSVAYAVFKDQALINSDKTFILSYLDGEREELILELIGKRYYKQKIKIDQEISIGDIARIHSIEVEAKEDMEPKYLNLAQKMFQLAANKEKKEQEEVIAALEGFFKVFSFMSNKYISIRGKQNRKKLEKLLAKTEEEAEAKLFGSIYQLLEISSLSEVGLSENSFEAIDFFRGFFLEDHIFNLLLRLKEQGVISQVVHSLKRKGKAFEVDIVAFRKYKLFCISVTICNQEEEVFNKLFEIKTRALQLGGQEAGICFVCFYESTEDLEKAFRNIWDKEENPKNTLLVAMDKLVEIEDNLKKWILGENNGRK